MIQTEQWFIDRIGKRIYRDMSTCQCSGCMDSVESGFIIDDKEHANELYNIQIDYAREGAFLNYRDDK